MRPWTIDADDIQVADDFDDALLYRTPWIDDFLSGARDEKFIVTAPKGFGKTLLLKAKRVYFQQNKGVLCLPENSLLDKPAGDKVFSAEMVDLYGQSTDNWRKVWLISIAAAVLKRLGAAGDLALESKLRSLLSARDLRSTIDHFANVLDFSRGDLFRAANETDTHLIPRLRGVSTPVAIFLDSIDEYFNKHIAGGGGRASDIGELSPRVWYLSQMALVEVAYQLRRVNHHIKVFAAIRKEAFSQLEHTTSMVQQYRGSTVDICYSLANLREIFIKNIEKEKKSKLASFRAGRTDPMQAFFGLTEVGHARTGLREDVFEYVYRHTLRRPRDLMTIGQKVSDIPPSERTEQAIKVAANRGATEIAREYLNEIAPYVGIQLDRVLSLLQRNVLSRREVESLSQEHDALLRKAGELPEGEAAHPFCTLFKLGLLGYVQQDVASGERLQQFLMPGERTFDPDGLLPVSPAYLVHPVLTEMIARRRPGYPESLDQTNIIGDDRPWLEPDPTQMLAVLRADVRSFSKIMNDPKLEVVVRQRLQSLVKEHAGGCAFAQVASGDAVTIVHRDPAALVKVIRRVMEDLFELEGQPLLRVAVDHGEVRLAPDPTGDAPQTSGLPFRTVARLEPHVTPNEIWATEAFKAAQERSPAFYEAVEIEPEIQVGPQWRDRLLNVKKIGSTEPDEWIRVFRLVDRRA